MLTLTHAVGHMRARVSVAALTLVLTAVVSLRSAAAASDASDGARLYTRYCASCHGAGGKGDGPDAAIFAAPPRDLRAGFLDAYPKDDLVRRVRDGRTLELALDREALRAHATDVEALVRYLQRLPSVDWPRALEGRDIYTDRCAVCHGRYGQPPAQLPKGAQRPRALSDPTVQRSIRDAQLTTVVRHGRKGMPALTPRVPEAEGPPLATFVRLLSPGLALYDRYCASCHGDDGHPVTTGGEVRPAPTVVFHRAYFASHDAEELHRTVWHMLADQKPVMPHYRWTLTDPQAAAIIEYLKSLK